MIILNSPSNPSGAVFDRGGAGADLPHRQGSGHLDSWPTNAMSASCMTSEPFSLASLPGAKETVVVAGSLSKTYAMTGWRMGFVLGPAAVVAGINKLQSHATSNPNSITQKAAIEALNGPQDSVAAMLAEYRKRREYVMGRLRKMPGVKTQTPQGAFLRLSERQRGVQRRHRQCVAILRKAAGRGVRRAGSGRSLRDHRTHPHLLCDFDEGVGARPEPAGAVHRRPRVMRRGT